MIKPRNSGFTLVEVTIVIALVSLLFVGIMSTFLQIQKLLNTQSQAAYQGKQAEELYSLLIHDIQNIVYEKWNVKYFFKAEKNITGGVRADTFNFITGSIYSNPSLFQAKVYNVTYFGETDDEKGGITLYRREDMMVDYKDTKRGAAIPVLHNLQEFRIEFSKNGDDWLDEWDLSTMKGIPNYLRINITYHEESDTGSIERKMILQSSPGILM